MHGGSPSLLGHTSCHQDWTTRLRNWHEESTSHKFHSCQVWVACWNLREQRLCLQNKIAEYDACHNMKSGASRQMVVSSKRLWRASKDNAVNSWQPKSKFVCLRLIVVSNEVSAVLQEKYRTWNKTANTNIHNYTQLTWTALQLLQLFDLNLSLLEKRLHILLSHLLEHCGQRSKLYRLYTASLAMSGCRHNCNYSSDSSSNKLTSMGHSFQKAAEQMLCQCNKCKPDPRGQVVLQNPSRNCAPLKTWNDVSSRLQSVPSCS